MSVFVLFLFPVSPTRSSAFLLGDRQAGIGELMERRTTTCNYGRQAGRGGDTRVKGERRREKGGRVKKQEDGTIQALSSFVLSFLFSFISPTSHIPRRIGIFFQHDFSFF